MKFLFKITIFVFLFCLYNTAFALEPSIKIIPDKVMQGEPFMVKVENTVLSDIKKITFLGKKTNVLMYESTPTAFFGIDLREKVGPSTLEVELKDGTILKQVVIIDERQKVEEPMGIPEKLGGNTKKSQDALVSGLAKEQIFFSNLFMSKKLYWTDKFILPVKDPVVTSPYGYSRKTGEYSIAHKGVDLRAPLGTKILAMNRGVVRVVKTSTTYGKTVVVDHGQGIMSFYLHLSKFKVKQGQIVERGQLVGLSGSTGYSWGPHVHLAVRINNIAIDPMKFMDFFR